MYYYFNDNDPQSELLQTLFGLIDHWEDEVVEFKQANRDFDQDKIGQYFSALSNEANLKGLQYGWLVFGVRNKDKTIVGSDYRDAKGLDTLKQEIADNTTGGISFIEIYEVFPEVEGEKKRVVMFQIPAAATAIPTGWKNHYYGRNGESLGALSMEEQDRIRKQEKQDWSRQIVPGATLAHLDPEAILIARENYKKKMNKPHISEEVDGMDDLTFLTKTKLVVDGHITNAAMLLLGNEDHDNLFASTPEASWRLFDSDEMAKDYEIFKIPFITVTDRIFAKIRNLTYRYMPNQTTLFPLETKQYDMWLLRELMNNCIAHSDYTIGGRIYLNEFEDRITISNPGTFLPGRIEPVLRPGYNPPFYRNQLLAEAMFKFNLIDTQTMGIRKVFKIQRDKFFPLPDYVFTEDRKVSVTVYGKVLNDNYSRVLFDHPDFDLTTVFLIDKVQKHERISPEAIKHLRKLGVIEGRAPNIYISADVAESMDKKAQYVKNKGLGDEIYKGWILQFLKTYGKGKKKDFMSVLEDSLPASLDPKQKEYKVRNLLAALKREGKIELDSPNKRLANWVLKK